MPNSSKTYDPVFRLSRRGLLLLVAAVLLLIAGYVLMSGPGSTEAAYNPDIFSARRIVLAPLLCLTGYLLVIPAVLWREGE